MRGSIFMAPWRGHEGDTGGGMCVFTLANLTLHRQSLNLITPTGNHKRVPLLLVTLGTTRRDGNDLRENEAAQSIQ